MTAKLLLTSAAMALSLSVAAAKADVHFVVTGAFDDGTALSGSFDLNVYGFVSDYNLMTAAGTLPGFHYVSGVINVLTPFAPPFASLDFLPGSYQGGLNLTFASPLQGAGTYGLVTGANGPSWENTSFTPGGAPIRYLVGGSATAAPELSTWAMALIGFAGLGFVRFRRSRVTSACATS